MLGKKSSEAPCTVWDADKTDQSCMFSDEAERVDLQGFLSRLKDAYFEYSPHLVAWKPDLVGKELTEYVKQSYQPYDPHPDKLKAKTDKSLALLKEITDLKMNKDLMTPRENKAIAQAIHFLQHCFDVPYDENFYNGDWMLGPNYFCWQPICQIHHSLNAYGTSAAPHTFDDVKRVIETIRNHSNIFSRYRQNMELGVKAGMVRSATDCQSSVYAFKNNYGKLAIKNESSAVLDEEYVQVFLEPRFLVELNKGVSEQWEKDKGRSIQDSLRSALIEGFGKPLLELIAYLEFKHIRHCPPDSVASGLSDLPLDYVYVDGDPDVNQKTTKTLPGTGKRLDGKETYRVIMSYFTTSDITPEQVYKEGLKQLNIFMPQVIDIAKQITKNPNETDAIEEFQKTLNDRPQWHNKEQFPENESNSDAYKKCIDAQSAQKYCPKRWAAVQDWGRYIEFVMSHISPKLANLFYFAGAKRTTGNCPIEMQPHYNPSNGAMYFQPSDSECSQPSYFGLPFFLKEYGPKFQEWSVTGHEARPGHHTQMQGSLENFRGSCKGLPEWLDKQTYYIAFQEGWALYGENPILSHDTDLYKSNLLQKYGMLKWQVWRAVRLVVDTGLHYRSMKRSEALEYFANYTWDTTDFAVKEVTRYQSDPGQATAYMLGRLELIKLRNMTEKELGSKFDLKEFHYQVLSQGSSPITYLQEHIERYIGCVKATKKSKICQLILNPPPKKVDDKTLGTGNRLLKNSPRNMHWKRYP
ncbi:uncharacterized protein LOC110254389 isoform X2 [Exaiptasia diaphana]|nr:uncharacterized protein LOC110254389 isoform X2 [Exaiptasia diaphana]